MKKKLNIGSDACTSEMPKQKERHIVSWSAEEDEILREQIRVHGTENWAIIASNFKDKSTRQCRRRWYTYLNSDFKKGGWSPEEDMLLCEAQKIFGNRWTEIAKVVSGRTDNAVKNRFTTLCKKKAKYEALAKGNNMSSFINLNNKRVIFPDGLSTTGGSESVPPLKKISIYISNKRENQQEKVASGCDAADNLLRPPFAVLAQNGPSGETKLAGQHLKEKPMDHRYCLNLTHAAENASAQGTFLKKDDPKVLALMKQAELLRSLAIKVNYEQTNQSLETAWMLLKPSNIPEIKKVLEIFCSFERVCQRKVVALRDYLKQNKECHLSAFPDHDDQLEKFEELVEDLRSCNEGSKTDTYDSSPASSDYSTGSTLPSNVPGDKTDEFQTEIPVLHQEKGHELDSDLLDNHDFLTEGGGDLCQSTSRIQVNDMLSCSDTNHNDEAAIECDNIEYNSPIHVTPFFRDLAATIPSPKFSESEKHFLMKTLGMDSTSSSPMTNSSQPPTCKRSLLHCL